VFVEEAKGFEFNHRMEGYVKNRVPGDLLRTVKKSVRLLLSYDIALVAECDQPNYNPPLQQSI
jgi:hypothetical protein